MRKKRRLVLPLVLGIILTGAIAWGGWMWYDSHIDRSGWMEKDGIRFYRDFHAQPVSGWLELDGSRYCFQEGGIPRLGWQSLEDGTYYFGDDGIMVTGWQTLEGKTYCFGTDGAMQEGWLQLKEGSYYLPGGVMATGWTEIDGQRYFFGDDGIMALDFVDLEGARYYFGTDGVCVTGDAEIDGQRYLFQDSGAMVTGWADDGEVRRYYLPDGPMATGWMELDSGRYYFLQDGAMATGWLQEGEYQYYLLPEGMAAVGPTEIEGATHYFTPKGIEVILVNARHKVPSYYKADLKQVSGYHYVDTRCYDALTQMLAGCNAAGIKYNFNSAYRSLAEQTQILELRTQEHMERYNLDFEAARRKALQTVAIPGTSEHHLGLAVDLLGDAAIAWLHEHCWDYGFIVRYDGAKSDITGIINEPWHFRYVGKEVALDMKDSGLCLEEYLGETPVQATEG